MNKFKFQKHTPNFYEYYHLLGFPYFDSEITKQDGIYYFTFLASRENYVERTYYCFDNLEKIQARILEELLLQCIKLIRVCLVNQNLSDITRIVRRECGLIKIQEGNFKYIIRHCKRFIKIHNTHGKECIDFELLHVYEQLNNF